MKNIIIANNSISLPQGIEFDALKCQEFTEILQSEEKLIEFLKNPIDMFKFQSYMFELFRECDNCILYRKYGFRQKFEDILVAKAAAATTEMEICFYEPGYFLQELVIIYKLFKSGVTKFKFLFHAEKLTEFYKYFQEHDDLNFDISVYEERAKLINIEPIGDIVDFKWTLKGSSHEVLSDFITSYREIQNKEIENYMYAYMMRFHYMMQLFNYWGLDWSIVIDQPKIDYIIGVDLCDDAYPTLEIFKQFVAQKCNKSYATLNVAYDSAKSCHIFGIDCHVIELEFYYRLVVLKKSRLIWCIKWFITAAELVRFSAN